MPNHDFHPSQAVLPALGLTVAGAAAIVSGVHKTQERLRDTAAAWTQHRYQLGIEFLEGRVRREVDRADGLLHAMNRMSQTIEVQQLVLHEKNDRIAELEGMLALAELRLSGHA